MSRRYTRRGTALLLVLAFLVSMLGAALPVMQKSGAASGTFATAYTALLEKAPVAQADLERDPYGLCRLVVTGYGGKDYGAVAAAVTDGLAILQYDTPLAARKAAAQLAQDGATAEPDSLCQLETDTNLTGNLCPWAGEMVGTTAFCARRQIPSHRVVIAQIDTGFMLDHPALQGRLVSDGIDLSGDGRANAAYDTRQRGATYWHATAVASVLAGNTDENVKILPYKVVRFGTDTCAASAVLAAMEDAVAKGARVLNMSLSTSQNRAGFAAMMDKAAALGVAVCCSAGNAGEQISNRYPSALPQAITVSAVTAFSVTGDDYTVAEGVLYSGDGTELICYPGGRVATDFTIPNGVTAVYAAAFLSAWQLQQVESASAVLIVTADGLLYGKNGRTLWMALPQFHQDTLVLRRAVLIAGGAFLLNHTLRTVYATAAVSVEPHGLGTAFSDGFVRRALTVYGLPGSVLETYCGTAIPFYPVNSGACGAETTWQYDLDTAALTISGSGPVADFAADVAPWALFGAEIRQVTVEDGVTALPESSFANCTGLTRVTLGSGIEKMDTNWFAHCPDLTELTVTATDTVFPAAVFAGVGDGLTLYGYYDTSVMDYARQHGLTFVPLGCLHRIYTDSGPAPTCTAGATRSRTCARCGADLGTVELPPNGHTYSETVQTAPTCTTTGCSKYTCTVCGDSYTADTPALGHNWVQRAYTAPTCCVAGRVQRYCTRCGAEKTNILSPTQPEGHFVKGTVTDKAGAPLENISVSLDGTPVAVTNENGVFLFEGVSCGDYTLTFCGDGCVPRSVPLSVSGGNTTAPAAVLLLVGDLNGDGYVNARDDVLAQRQAVSPSDGANLSVNRVLPKVTLDRIYGVQAKIGVLYIRQSAEEDGTYRRQFEVNVRAFNEYRVVDCGFLYGKNMAETDLVPERVGTTNAQGYAVKRMPAACTPGRKVLLYGSSSATGQVSARFYITYTNGVMTKTYLSEVCTYDYDEA